MVKVFRQIPLGTRCNFKRSHLLDDVNGRDVERKRIQAASDQGVLRGRKVPVPRLKCGTRLRNVKANLHNLVVGPEHGLANGFDPWMSGQLDEATYPFRMDLHIVT